MRRGITPWTALAAVLLAVVAPFRGGAELSDAEIASASRAYFAPMSSFSFWRMRMPDGLVREFSPSAGKGSPDILDSVDGWTAQVKGFNVLVKTPRGERPKQEWGFENGRLTMFAVDGQPYGFDYSEPIVYEGEKPQSLWPKASELEEEDYKVPSKWDKGKRFRLWFRSPNRAGTFLSYFALAALALAAALRRRWAAGLSLAAAVGMLTLVGLTDSRGALLGFAVGALVIVVCRLRSRGVSFKAWLMALALLVVLLAGAVVWLRCVSPRSTRSYARSDSTRHAIVAALPKMFAAAPGGWGRYGLVGRAYFDWFERGSVVNPKLNLVSDHLSRLVGAGWVRGGLYVFAWAAGWLLLLFLAWRGASPLPCALWASLGTAAAFNLIFCDWEMWVPPIASLLLLLPARPWRQWRCAALAAGAALLVALAVVGGILAVAAAQPPAVPTVARDGRRMLIGGANPTVWVVDDLQSLGHVMAPKEIRWHYRRVPDAAPIGYVRSLADLPDVSRIELLVLAGNRGRQYLKQLAGNVGDQPLPGAIVFLSPNFGPEEIPEALARRTPVAVLIGEFAARYYLGYARAPDWVTIVPGAEQYIPGWMRFVAK